MNSKFRNFPEERLGVLESENRYMDGWCLHEHTNVFVYKTWYITQRQETFFKAFFVLFIFSIKEIIKTRITFQNDIRVIDHFGNVAL